MTEVDVRRNWLVLVPLALGVFVVVMDVSVINVALPSIREDLGYLDVTVADLQWVVNVFSLAFAVLMLAGGKLADIFGRRLVFVIGLAVLALASLGAGLSDRIDLLIGFRALQGVGGALVLPASLSIITVGFPPEQRAKAVAIWSALVGLGVAIGPLVGGLLSEEIDWRAVFLVNVPFCALAFALSLMLVGESRAPAEHRRLDGVGALLSAASLFCLVFGLQKANEFDWGDPRTLGLLTGALVAGVGFALWERRTDAPMLDLALFRSPTFTGANVVSLVSGFVLIGAVFYINLLTQSALAFGPVEAGAALLPVTVLSVAFAPLAGRLTDRYGPRWVLASGMLLLGVALVALAPIGLGSRYWNLLPGLVVMGIGFAFVLTPVTAAALAGVPMRQAGIGSAVVNMTRQAGGALGLAVMGAVSADIVTDSLAKGQTSLDGFVEAFGPVMLVGAAAGGLGAVISAALVVGKRLHAPSATPPPEAPPGARPSVVGRVSWTVPAPEAGRSIRAITQQLAVLGEPPVAPLGSTKLRVAELPAPAAGAQLEVVAGPATGTRLRIGGAPFVLGRAETHEGRLGDDPKLSRRHASVSLLDSARILIEDLGSTNGTFVNDVRIDAPTVVGSGDCVQVGGTALRVVAADPAPAPTAAGEVS